MNLKDILSISGKGGLFKFISQGRNGVIVESFEDKKRLIVHSSTKVSALEDISVFTQEEEIPLADVLKNIFEKTSGGESIDYKSDPETLKKYFGEILPEYDREKVYVSDIKKIINWYNILHKFDLLRFEEEKEEEKENTTKEKQETTKAARPATENKEKSVSKAKMPAKPKTKQGSSTTQRKEKSR
ncbi:MAG: DUF5606 domain-containing protein [Bacteroidales bacterium]|nr:DUF5606 domain-containing protein [Bacteroidales bacterium]